MFKYEDIKKVNKCLEWYVRANSAIEFEVEEVLKSLKVPKEKMQKFTTDYKYYYKRDGSSKLYIVFNEELKEVYIIENMF